MKKTTLSFPIFTLAATWGVALAQSPERDSLARHFGFESPRFLIAGDGAGPALAMDINGDGRGDVALVNNRSSRIEIFLQRERPLEQGDLARQWRANELPPSRWYERVPISVPHRVTSLTGHDMDDDGRLDLVYLASSGELALLRQDEEGEFDLEHRWLEPGVQPTRNGLAVANVIGDERPEVVVLGRTGLLVFEFEPAAGFLEGRAVGAGPMEGALAAVFAEDFNGDGLTDLLAAAPENSAPLLLWLGREIERRRKGVPDRAQGAVPRLGDGAVSRGGRRRTVRRGVLGPALRFETPALREAAPVRFPKRDGASIVVIERASRRITTYDVAKRQGLADGEAIASPASSHGYPGGAQRNRPALVTDLDDDGLPDVLAADQDGASLLLYRQDPSIGFMPPARFGTLKAPSDLAVGQWDEDRAPEVFVLSEEEKTVGVAHYDRRAERLGFPEPVRLATGGVTPVAVTHLMLADGPAAAVVVKDRRDYAVEIHRPDGASTSTALPGVRRPPEAIRAGDIDGDGAPDLLLLTPGQPMTLVLSDEAGPPRTVVQDDEMPQFGLVQAAGPDNTALADITRDGRPELLLADANFVRICRYDRETGWRVLEQATLADASARLTGLAVLPVGAAFMEGAAPGRPILVAANSAAAELVFFGYDSDAEGGPWTPVKRIELPGADLGAIEAVKLRGQRRMGLAALGDAGFSIIGLGDAAVALTPVATHRSQRDDRLEHEAAAGDVNSDGFVDLVVLDAEEQMCQILTYDAERRLHFATEFQVFESRVFTGGESREFEPSEAHVADVTGDGAQDLILVAHDRAIIHPQMTAPEE